MERESLPVRMLQIVLALMLLGSLVWAGARIYRRLPATGGPGVTALGQPQDLTIVLRVSVVLLVTTAGPPLYMCHAAYSSLNGSSDDMQSTAPRSDDHASSRLYCPT